MNAKTIGRYEANRALNHMGHWGKTNLKAFQALEQINRGTLETQKQIDPEKIGIGSSGVLGLS